jgi:thiamine pyrophosphate-dependent acetolactate synthase large subunit-like protein
VTNLACRTALGYYGVAHITLPVDLQSMEFDKKQTSKRNIPGHSEPIFTARHRLCGEILDRALAEPGPTIIEAIVDPHEPPQPAKVSLEQAAHLAKSLAKGTPNRTKIALTLASDKVRELI